MHEVLYLHFLNNDISSVAASVSDSDLTFSEIFLSTVISVWRSVRHFEDGSASWDDICQKYLFAWKHDVISSCKWETTFLILLSVPHLPNCCMSCKISHRNHQSECQCRLWYISVFTVHFHTLSATSVSHGFHFETGYFVIVVLRTKQLRQEA